MIPRPLPLIEIDPPTISMNFIPNDSPFAGQDGKFVTSRHIEERLSPGDPRPTWPCRLSH